MSFPTKKHIGPGNLSLSSSMIRQCIIGWCQWSSHLNLIQKKIHCTSIKAIIGLLLSPLPPLPAWRLGFLGIPLLLFYLIFLIALVHISPLVSRRITKFIAI